MTEAVTKKTILLVVNHLAGDAGKKIINLTLTGHYNAMD